LKTDTYAFTLVQRKQPEPAGNCACHLCKFIKRCVNPTRAKQSSGIDVMWNSSNAFAEYLLRAQHFFFSPEPLREHFPPKLRMLCLHTPAMAAIAGRRLERNPMNRLIAAAVAALLLSPALAFAADTHSATGQWAIDGDVMGQPVKMICRLVEADHKVSGTCAGAADNYAPHPVAGKVAAQKVEFHFDTAMQGNSISVIVTGTLSPDGAKVDGELDIEPMAVGGQFSGMRMEDTSPTAASPSSSTASGPTPTPAAKPTPSPLSSTGTWKVSADVQGTPVNLTCTLAEASAKLTGACTGDDGAQRALTGEVTAKGLSWKFDSAYEGSPITVFLSGSLTPDSAKMNGTMSVSPMGVDGTFSATRQ
jgi:hypothetical protein